MYSPCDLELLQLPRPTDNVIIVFNLPEIKIEFQCRDQTDIELSTDVLPDLTFTNPGIPSEIPPELYFTSQKISNFNTATAVPMATNTIVRALLNACKQGSLAEAHFYAQQLLADGISRQTGPPFKLAMATAAYQGHAEILRSLMNTHIQNMQHADSPWNPTITGRTDDIPQEWTAAKMSDLVVYRATRGGKPHVMQTLMDFGLTPDHEIDKMGSPLGIAIRGEKVDMVRFLLEKGADPNGMYWIPPESFLLKAASLNSPDIMKALQDHGAKLKGSMALRGAAKNGRIDSAKILLEQGADVDEIFLLDLFQDERDNLGTALHIAAKHKQHEFVNFLLAYGAKQDLKDGDGLTAREAAVAHGNDGIASLLT